MSQTPDDVPQDAAHHSAPDVPAGMTAAHAPAPLNPTPADAPAAPAPTVAAPAAPAAASHTTAVPPYPAPPVPQAPSASQAGPAPAPGTHAAYGQPATGGAYVQPGAAYARPGAAYAQPGVAYAQPGAPTAPFGGSHPGAPQGQAFGVAATQPTQPLSPSTPATPKKKSGAGRVVALLVAAALVGGAAGLGGSYAGERLFDSGTTAAPSGGGAVVVNNTDDVTATTAIAAKVLPSVVTIAVSSSTSGGSGSGAILSKDGYVVTNTHVVTLDGATGTPEIQVTTSDGRIFAAEIVGLDPVYDLAVLKLKGASDLTPIEFGSSADLNVGDVAVAVGAPLGLENTVTTGIISALDRSIEIASSAVPETTDETTPDDEQTPGSPDSPFQFDIPGRQQQSASSDTIKIAVLQTDAAINPGNSGGALVDDEGRLIGINVAIATASGTQGQAGSIGVGFSIPSDIVQRVTDELIADGVATHGLLGATVRDASAQDGASVAGAYIDSTTDGGGAQAAGLQQGDVVTAVDGQAVTDAVDLTAQVRARAAGAEVELTYVRDGRTQTTTATLGALQ